MVRKILASLEGRHAAGEVRLTLSCGIQKKVFERVLGYISDAGLRDELDRGLEIVYEQDVYAYLERFNARLRRTDVLWTKPSELAFYCGLGLPILMADPIGAHEELNKRWLREIHAGVSPRGPSRPAGNGSSTSGRTGDWRRRPGTASSRPASSGPTRSSASFGRAEIERRRLAPGTIALPMSARRLQLDSRAHNR